MICNDSHDGDDNDSQGCNRKTLAHIKGGFWGGPHPNLEEFSKQRCGQPHDIFESVNHEQILFLSGPHVGIPVDSSILGLVILPRAVVPLRATRSKHGAPPGEWWSKKWTESGS